MPIFHIPTILTTRVRRNIKVEAKTYGEAYLAALEEARSGDPGPGFPTEVDCMVDDPNPPYLTGCKTFIFVSHNLIPYLIRIVEKGQRHGSEMCLTHDLDDPIIEVYNHSRGRDRDYIGDAEEAEKLHAPFLGYQVSSYRLSTLMSIGYGHGLQLAGGDPQATWIPGDVLHVQAKIAELRKPEPSKH